MADHLQDARNRVVVAANNTVRHGGVPSDVSALVLAVRHQVAEEIRRDIQDLRGVSRPAFIDLVNMVSNIDPYRIDPTTNEWIIK